MEFKLSTETKHENFNYIPALDGWRAVSIILVIISHGGLGHLVPGGLGVTIFFFISGYLITSLLISELRTSSKISIRKFYLRRFWRLSPPVVVYVLLSGVLIYLVTGKINMAELAASIFYFANYYTLYWGYEPLPFGPSPLKILWSLAVEEHYYIFFAPLLAIVFNNTKKLFFFIIFLILTPLLLRFYLVYIHSETFVNQGMTYMATELRVDSIAWGALLAWLVSKYSSSTLSKIFDKKMAIGLGVTILILCLVLRDERFRESLRYSLQGLALLPIFYATLYGRSANSIKGLLQNKYLVMVGKLSYSLYLYHWLALVLANLIVGSDKLTYSWMIFYYFLSIILAVASYRFIEVPSLVLRKRYGSHASA